MQLTTNEELTHYKDNYKKLIFKSKLVFVLGIVLILAILPPAMMFLSSSKLLSDQLIGYLLVIIPVFGILASYMLSDFFKTEAKFTKDYFEEASPSECAELESFSENNEVKNAVREVISLNRKLTRNEYLLLIQTCKYEKEKAAETLLYSVA